MSPQAPRSPGAELAVALGASTWESGFVSELVSALNGVRVRRCVDVVDLVGCVDRDGPAMVLVDDRFPRLDTPTTSRLAGCGAFVVGLYGDHAGKTRLANLGIDVSIPVEAGTPVDAVAAVEKLYRERVSGTARANSADQEHRIAGSSSEQQPTAAVYPDVADHRQMSGDKYLPGSRIIAVWGPPGAPGRTHIAVTLAQHLSEAGRSVLLVDADTTCAGIGPAFCLTEEGSGLIAATHHAQRGSLDPEMLARLARAVDDDLRLLTGIPHIRRRAELRAAPLARLWSVARSLSADVVIDIGSVLDDGALAFDGDVGEFGLAAGGNAAAVTALAAADHLVTVSSAEPSALARFSSHVEAITSLAPSARQHIVVNRVRSSVLPSKRAIQEVAGYLQERSCAASISFVADDRAGSDAAVARGLTLFEHDRKSAAVTDVVSVVEGLALVPLAVGA